MNNFKKNIYKTVGIVVPTYFQFNVLEGTIVCSASMVAFNNPNPVILYSNTNSLVNGTVLYTDTLLTNLALYSGIKLSSDVYELTSGVISLVTIIGNPC